MEKLSKMLLALKSPDYAAYLEVLSDNVPGLDNNIKLSQGRASMDVKHDDLLKTLVFPKYGDVQRTLTKLREARDAMFFDYRFLRNKLYYTETPSKDIETKYDSVVRKLRSYDADIEILEMYKGATWNDARTVVEQIENDKQKIASGIKRAYDENKLTRCIEGLAKIHELNKASTETSNTHVDYYLTEMPSLTVKEVQPRAEPKKRAKKAKGKLGGGRHRGVDEDRLKTVVKQTMMGTKKIETI